MRETTFNSPCQINGENTFKSVDTWLGMFYRQALKFDDGDLIKIHSLLKLQEIIQYHFKNQEILMKALVQSTFYYENKNVFPSIVESNERLEFLGDSLINFLAAKDLFERYPDLEEGSLSKIRSALVNEFSLSTLATAISLGENLFLGKGEYQNLGNLKTSLLADTLEALIAAVYIDSGKNFKILEKTWWAIIKKFEKDHQVEFFSIDHLEYFDSKTKLQELTMALFQIHPTYKTSENEKGFLVELWLGDKKCAEGVGVSKKKLEKELARIVLAEKRYQ